ncbi:MAG TPA: four helix bundle protein [Acidobacteriaceae bacterium]|jgi:four helix bundle protein|nr:four helix bundle protein [Acidobacteriaceae bacterium]
MDTRRFRDLQVWQRSMALARYVYAATESLPQSELFGLSSQIRRAAVSIPSNIAEGRGRTTDKSFAAFLSQARGSLYELQPILSWQETSDTSIRVEARKSSPKPGRLHR